MSASNSPTPIKGRISELSLNGCYIATPAPLEKGTPVGVKINTETEFFEAQGSVIYVQPNDGMGLMFSEAKPYYMSVLKKWLLSAMLSKGRSSD